MKKFAIICLGQQLYKNGTLPNSLISRVQSSIDLVRDSFKNNKNDCDFDRTIIFSGGDVANIGTTEAEAMLNYFKLNIHFNTENFLSLKVLLDNCSKNTIENAINCKPMICSLECRNIDIVTNEFHAPRAKLIFENVLKNETICIFCRSANSEHEKFSSYRLKNFRPKEVNEWRLCERLDWELHAIENINEAFARYGLDAISSLKIDAAIDELKQLNSTFEIGNNTQTT
jgi:hypothetical protein